MKMSKKWMLVIALVLIAVNVVFRATMRNHRVSDAQVVSDLDAIANSRNSEKLSDYFKKNINKDNVGVLKTWLDKKVETTNDFYIPLFYSQILAVQAVVFKGETSSQTYMEHMTKAAAMYFFGDIMLNVDSAKCKYDLASTSTAATTIESIRTLYGRPMSAFLATETDPSLRKKILMEAFAREDKIESRPADERVCAFGYQAGQYDTPAFVTPEEMRARRASTIQALKTAYIQKYLNTETKKP